MTQGTARRNDIAQALGVLCIVLVFAMSTAQAVHSNANGSQTSHHSCSICSAPSLGPATTTANVLPMVRPVAMAYRDFGISVIFRPPLTNFVRPPPAA